MEDIPALLAQLDNVERLRTELARSEANHAAAMERLFHDLAMRRREHYATKRRAENAEAVLRELDVTDDQVHDVLRRLAARRRGAGQSRLQQSRIHSLRDGSTP